MKITINFTTEEKRTFFNLLLNTSNEKEITDENFHYAGNFGETKYDCKTNQIEIDLKASFIKAYTGLILSITNMIKSFISTCEMFSDSWFSDVKDLNKKEEETTSNNSNNDFAIEVANQIKE